MWLATLNHRAWLLEVSRRREPDPDPAVPCPACRRELRAIGVGAAFVLLCACGRQVTPDEARKLRSSSLDAGLAALLRIWEDKRELLKGLCADARSSGFHDVCLVIDRHRTILETRMEILRGLVQARSTP